LFEQLHGTSTLGTENGLGPRLKLVRCVVVGSEIRESVVWCCGQRQQRLDLLESVALLRVEEAIGTHLLEPEGRVCCKKRRINSWTGRVAVLGFLVSPS
jgi:hypothetical protein